MRIKALAIIVTLLLSSWTAVGGQQSRASLQQDLQAGAILRQSVAAMASTIPTDSSATGNVTIVEGSNTQSGSIQILTRGMAETVETITLPGDQRSVVYSNGDAKEVTGAQSSKPALEIIVTDQCKDFPLPLLLAILNNPDEAFRFIGSETLNGVSVQHIQVWNTFSSKPQLQNLASFSILDIWFDTSSVLPIKLAYSIREGSGAVPSVAVEISYSNYKLINGVQYPVLISKSLNGTPWMTITVSDVSFNTGVSDSEFSVIQEQP